MIEEPTCLILGAGASKPYGLPTSNELRDLIVSCISPNGRKTAGDFPIKVQPPSDADPTDPVAEWVCYLSRQSKAAGLVSDQIEAFWNNFFRADQSIDWFIRDNEASFGAIARLQIAAVLLNCEREALLTGDWYRLLSQRLLPKGPNSLEEGRLSVISFNYDRSFERYFCNVLQSQHGLCWSDAKDVVARIKIEHVYGQLGTLDEVPYGDVTKARKAAKGIRLIRPEADPSVREKLAALIKDAVYVNFIGFGFDDDNIALLGSENFKNKRIYSTSRGLNPQTRTKLTRTLGLRFHSKEPPNLTAQQLFETKDLFGPKRPSSSETRPRVVTRPMGMPRRWGTGWRI